MVSALLSKLLDMVIRSNGCEWQGVRMAIAYTNVALRFCVQAAQDKGASTIVALQAETDGLH